MPYYYKKRICAIYALVLVMICFLALRLYKLSDGNASRQVLFGQYTRSFTAQSRSGFVYDRNMRLISHDAVGKIAVINPYGINKDINAACFELCKYNTEYTPSSLCYQLISGKTIVLELSENADKQALEALGGIYVFEKHREKNDIAVHLCGYKNSDGVGVTGMNKAMEQVLKNLSGRVDVSFEANAQSGVISDGGFEVSDVLYSTNQGLVLTIDEGLQRFVESLEGKFIEQGAITVCDARTGEILAAASFPSYKADNVAAYLSSGKGELTNRLCETYTPGSVFKLVVAAAALEKNVNLQNFEYDCKGSIEVQGNSFSCHQKSGHGKQRLHRAFANSCNTYFIALGQQIGMECIMQTAQKMGLGQKVFADFLVSKQALLPDTQNDNPTLLANISFGQGTLLVSPLDMMNVINICATGKKPKLGVVRGIYNGKKLIGSPENVPQIVLKPDTVQALREMMVLCVRNGTGTAAKSDGIFCGGKTATAQTGQIDKDGNEVLHRWFCGMMPANDPEITITVLCDGNGQNVVSSAEIYRIVNNYVKSSKILY